MPGGVSPRDAHGGIVRDTTQPRIQTMRAFVRPCAGARPVVGVSLKPTRDADLPYVLLNAYVIYVILSVCFFASRAAGHRPGFWKRWAQLGVAYVSTRTT